MLSYISKRILGAIPVFFGITLIVFFMISLAPATILDAAGEGFDSAGTAARAEAEARLGLDDPFALRYLHWLGALLQGDLGNSFRTGQPVMESILQRVPPSLILTGTGVLLAVAIGIGLGTLAAWKPGSLWDKLASGISLLSFSMPGFCLCLLGIYFFAVCLRLLPASGMYSSGVGGGFYDLLRHLVLPALTICIGSVGNILRQTRSACLEVFGEPYITAARAKGLSERRVIWRHGLRAASIPVLTTVLGHIPHVIGGSMIVERIFAWPGMGSLLFLSVSKRDDMLVMGVTVLVALAVLAANLLMDIAYRLIDPRLRDGRDA